MFRRISWSDSKLGCGAAAESTLPSYRECAGGGNGGSRLLRSTRGRDFLRELTLLCRSAVANHTRMLLSGTQSPGARSYCQNCQPLVGRFRTAFPVADG